jgi:hypothetical protein
MVLFNTKLAIHGTTTKYSIVLETANTIKTIVVLKTAHFRRVTRPQQHFLLLLITIDVAGASSSSLIDNNGVLSMLIVFSRCTHTHARSRYVLNVMIENNDSDEPCNEKPATNLLQNDMTSFVTVLEKGALCVVVFITGLTVAFHQSFDSRLGTALGSVIFAAFFNFIGG